MPCVSNSSFSSSFRASWEVFRQVLTVQPQEIEGVILQTVLAASCDLGLQFGKIGTAFVNDHDLAVWKVEGAGNDGEALNPIVIPRPIPYRW